MSELVLQLEQASSEFTLHRGAALADFTEALSRKADVVSFTEVAERNRDLRAACNAADYQLQLADLADTALAVKGIHKIVAAGQHASVPAEPGPARDGGHGPRPVLWVSFRPFGTLETVTVHSGHWPTKRSDTGHQQVALTREMADLVAGHSWGDRLGFWMGDTNNDDRRHQFTAVDHALAKGDLTSCWDELGRWPDTHERQTLDVIGSYDPDRRVSCLRARVWPAGHSDHRPVSAWYSIRPVRTP